MKYLPITNLSKFTVISFMDFLLLQWIKNTHILQEFVQKK